MQKSILTSLSSADIEINRLIKHYCSVANRGSSSFITTRTNPWCAPERENRHSSSICDACMLLLVLFATFQGTCGENGSKIMFRRSCCWGGVLFNRTNTFYVRCVGKKNHTLRVVNKWSNMTQTKPWKNSWPSFRQKENTKVQKRNSSKKKTRRINPEISPLGRSKCRKFQLPAERQ